MKKIVVAYIPVLHRGYLEFLQDANADAIFLIQNDVIAGLGDDFEYLVRKDVLRAVSASEMSRAIRALSLLSMKEVRPLDTHLIQVLQHHPHVIICPDEDVTRAVIKKHFSSSAVVFSPIFLRWNRDNVLESKAVQSHHQVHLEDFHRTMMSKTHNEAKKSFDWWRQVGAVLVKDRTPLIFAHNQHTPNEQTPYAFGDPRSIFKRGIHLELSTAEHGEAIVIAEAARQGIATQGTQLYVSAFPCPPCAKLVARSGITHCYFGGGYAVLDGEANLRNAGVELVLVSDP
jgi:dCMP deaminase